MSAIWTTRHVYIKQTYSDQGLKGGVKVYFRMYLILWSNCSSDVVNIIDHLLNIISTGT